MAKTISHMFQNNNDNIISKTKEFNKYTFLYILFILISFFLLMLSNREYFTQFLPTLDTFLKNTKIRKFGIYNLFYLVFNEQCLRLHAPIPVLGV